MSNWSFPTSAPEEELAELHYFSVKKKVAEGEVEFVITVYEYAHRNHLAMKFYALADKNVNQGVAPFPPFGWGESLSAALSECLATIRKYPYEAEK